MLNLIEGLLTKLMFVGLRRSTVANFDGVRLTNFEKDKKKAEAFREILLASLHLLKTTDPRHFRRVQKRLDWVLCTTLEKRGLAKYNHQFRCCEIDLLTPSAAYDREWLIGWYACVLVHEATHGVIRSRNILYTPALRIRIERLCAREEQRFVVRLSRTDPGLATRLHRKFDASEWNWYWNTSRGENLRAQMRRTFFPKHDDEE